MAESRTCRLMMSCIYPELPYRSIPKNYSDARNVNSEICEGCGQCCKRCGCYFSPDDFEEISFEFLKKEIEKGYISIEFYDGEASMQNIGVYILRIRNQGRGIVDSCRKDISCILLGENGCKLDYQHRPSGGKLMIPEKKFFINSVGKKQRNCRMSYTIIDCCYEWLPHKRILAELVDYFKHKDIPCSL